MVCNLPLADGNIIDYAVGGDPAANAAER